MTEEGFIKALGWIVVGATASAFLARRIGMPGIVAYLLAGLVLGPATGLVAISPSLALISEIGIALLLFIVGLELSFDRIREVGRIAVLAGVFQIVLTLAGGYALSCLLGYAWRDALFLAIGLTFSSTVVVVKLLDEKGDLNTGYGRTAVGIFLVQDLVAIIILTVLAGLGSAAGGAATLEPNAVAGALARAFGGMGVLLAGSLAAARYLLPRPFAWSARRPEVLLVWSLAWCFALVWASHALNLSLEIGAFLAGVSLAQLPYNEDLHRRVHPLMNFGIAVFFVGLGIRMEVGAAVAAWPSVLALSLFVLFGKPAMFVWCLTRLGQGLRPAFLTSVTVAQISEFSFIVAALGVNAGLIDRNVLALTGLVGLVTITTSAYLIRFAEPLYRIARRHRLLHPLLPARLQQALPPIDESSPPHSALENHVIVVGMNSLGRRIARTLAEDGQTVVAVDTDPQKLAGLPCRTFLGNVTYRAVLDHLDLPHARLLVSALRIDAANELLAYRCREAGVRCALHVHDLREMDRLLGMDTAFLILSKVDGVKHLNRQLADLGCPPRSPS